MTKQELLKQLELYPEPFACKDGADSLGELNLDEKRTRYTKLILENSKAFYRSSLSSHFTSSAWVVNPGFDSVILTHHKKLKKWLQLGGHADGDENLIEVARREAIEEAGLQDFYLLSQNIFDLEIHMIPERPGEPEHLHYNTCYLFQTRTKEPLTISDESIDLAWVSLKELERYSTEDNILRMRAKTLLWEKSKQR